MFSFISDLQKRTEADKITAAWSDFDHESSEAELETAAQLAMEGYLSSVKEMNIVNIIENIVNISEISSDNIGKLTSIVTDEVYINNMTPVSQLGAILASVQSEVLSLQNMSLNEENTRALVTAMRARVQSVVLWNNVTLDLELLAAYDGEGRCTRLELRGDTRAKYETRLRRWAGDKVWAVTEDDSPALSSLKSLWMQRI